MALSIQSRPDFEEWIFKEQGNYGVEGVNDNIGILFPDFIVTITILSKQPISFNIVTERIIPSDEDLAKHIRTLARSIGEP